MIRLLSSRQHPNTVWSRTAVRFVPGCKVPHLCDVAGDLTLGCWSADPQGNAAVPNDTAAPHRGSCSGLLPDQADTPAAGRQPLMDGQPATAFDDMNLTAYFASLTDGNAACGNLITPLTVRALLYAVDVLQVAGNPCIAAQSQYL